MNVNRSDTKIGVNTTNPTRDPVASSGDDDDPKMAPSSVSQRSSSRPKRCADNPMRLSRVTRRVLLPWRDNEVTWFFLNLDSIFNFF